MTEQTDVMQADRDAAAAWAKSNSRAAQAANIRRGSCDSAPIVQAFARHRLAHSPVDQRLREAAQPLLDLYVELANSGDCGNWNPETEAEVIALRTALAAPLDEGWLPIGDAPKDGTPILIFQPDAERESTYMPIGALADNECSYRHSDPRLQRYDDHRWAIGYWRPWGGWGNRNCSDVRPTHYRPLPSAPTSPILSIGEGM